MAAPVGSRILVIGGTGMLGRPVARALRHAGYAVRVLTRDAGRARACLGDGFEVAVGDVDDDDALAAALEGCRGAHINLQGGADHGLEPRGADAVARLGAGIGLERVSLISGATVCEANCRFAGTAAKFAAETALRRSGLPYCIFRPTWFMESLPRFVRGRTAVVMGRQPVAWHWLAAEDYARMVAVSFATDAAAGRTFTILGPEVMTLGEALTRYCARMSPDTRIRSMPFWLLTALAALTDNRQLKAALPLMRYFETVRETGDPGPANDLFGRPTTTLDDVTARLRPTA